MKCTKENLEMMLDLQVAFEERALAIVKEKYRMENERTLVFDAIKTIDYDMQEVDVEFIRYRNCSCCTDEEETYTFPTSWLFDDNWKENYRLEIQNKQEKTKRKNEEEQTKRQEEKERQEKEQYERLKEKFKNKQFLIVYYNRFANQTQSTKVEAENAFRAGRIFYRKHNRKAYHACIEFIEEI